MNERASLDHIFNENIDKVKEIIESNKGLGLNFINKELNTTPLICAIDAVNPEIVELLLNKGSNPNLGHNGLSLPLYHAIKSRYERR